MPSSGRIPFVLSVPRVGLDPVKPARSCPVDPVNGGQEVKGGGQRPFPRSGRIGYPSRETVEHRALIRLTTDLARAPTRPPLLDRC